MDFKFDIRILIVSLLIHFGVFGLLSYFVNKAPKKNEAIEIVIQNDQPKKMFIPSEPKEKKTPVEEARNSKFFSEDPMRVKKETIADNLGSFQNQQSKKTQASQGENSPTSESAKGESLAKNKDSGIPQNFLPGQQQAAQEDRQSAINFQVPNLSKGEFTFLNSDFSTYASFYNRITPKIIYNWGNNIEDIALFPHMREKLRTKFKWVTRVELILDSKGHVKKTMIINSSGSPELDTAVRDALNNAGPYLNPPTGMIEKDGTVHISGEFTVYTQRPHYANPNN